MTGAQAEEPGAGPVGTGDLPGDDGKRPIALAAPLDPVRVHENAVRLPIPLPHQPCSQEEASVFLGS
jgi:hypothetical protein